MRQTRVAYLLDECPAVSQTFVADEIAYLRSGGRQVDVLVRWPRPASPGPAGGPAFEALMEVERPGAARRSVVRHPVRVVRARRLLLAADPLDAPGLPWGQLLWWADELRRRRVTVLHAHFGWSAAARARVLSTLTGLPWAVTLHGNDVFGSPVDLRAKLRAATAPITVCAYFRDHLEQVGGVPVTVIPCGVDVMRVGEPGPGELAGRVDVVCVARLVPKKGVDVLLRALALVRAGRPTLSATIVGDGPERPALLRLRATLGLEDCVQMRGATPHIEALAHIGRARAFVLACRVAADGDRDSMPVVVKEAMARGVPVVVTREVGLPELVDPSTGWLVPPDAPGDLAAAILEVLVDPAEAQARARRARAWVVHTQGLAVTVGAVAELHDRLTRDGSRLRARP